ncbi:hypothetical protein Y1Q_0014387 [Alligator mississippiensis]|uniref:Uncharacterized protein n=1 Tax=Alligator mississippiensis TaxID=8496 RepID=A0A151PCE0_ALLMI|nr:hypothetical protein Y1Q_0014387 [Alligator mississippiensis]
MAGHQEQDEPSWEETPTRFISHAYFWLEPAWTDDIIDERHPAGIKAGTSAEKKRVVETVKAEGALHAGIRQHRHAAADPAPGGAETWSSVKGQAKLQALGWGTGNAPRTGAALGPNKQLAGCQHDIQESTQPPLEPSDEEIN